jgi:hypothetical protein
VRACAACGGSGLVEASRLEADGRLTAWASPCRCSEGRRWVGVGVPCPKRGERGATCRRRDGHDGPCRFGDPGLD